MADDEYKEITLADLVSTIYRRRLILIAVFMVSVIVGVSITVFATPEYEATATVVPLENADIIKNHLDSRRAGEVVYDMYGDALVSRLFPGQWDADAQSWRGEPPTRIQVGSLIAGMTSVQGSQLVEQEERLVTVTVTSSDPVLARDVANAVLDSLQWLRPEFENLTIEQKFETYYQQNGGNAQAARRDAEAVAQSKSYWFILDTATTPGAPSSPNVTLNIALSVVLGLMLGVFSVFVVEWASNYRADRRQVDAPEPHDEGFRYRK